MGYETDISDKEWAILEPLLAPKQKGRPDYALSSADRDAGFPV